jgi:hypothetical protein
MFVEKPIDLMHNRTANATYYETILDRFSNLCENDDSEREVNKDFTAALSMLRLALYRLLTGKRLAPWKRTGTDRNISTCRH